MPCLPTILSLLFPRLMIVILWLVTDWFKGVFDSLVWPILGFLFAPLGTLWFGAVHNYYHGEWNTLQIIVMVIALGFDFGFLGNSARNRKKRK